MPQPEPQPSEGMTPEQKAKQEAELKRLLLAVRYQLGHRNLKAAQALLKRAETISNRLSDSPVAEEYERVATLAHYVEQFWHAVAEGVRGLASVDQVTIDGITVGVVEVTPRSITLRQAGRNRTYTLQTMPTGLAVGLAQRWLDQSQASSYLILGAYFAVDPKNRKQRARAFWQRAAQMGLAEEVQALLPELEVRIPSTSPLADGGKSSLPRAEDGRWQLPPQRRLTTLLRGWRERYQNQLAMARTAEARRRLAQTLKQVAQATSDPLERFLAQRLAAEVLAPVALDQACGLVDHLAQDYQFSVPDAKVKLAFAAVNAAKDAATLKKLAPALWDLADELALEDHAEPAVRFLRALETALRKAELKELARQTAERISQVRSLQM